MKSTLIIGIGNRYRSDDAAGALVAERLKSRFETLEHDGEPAALIEAWQKRDTVILVDAVSSGAAPGTLFLLDLREQKLPDIFRQTSTHAFGVAEAVELARALGRLPPAIVFYGIEGGNFSAGGDISPEVLRSVKEVEKSIIQRMEGVSHA